MRRLSILVACALLSSASSAAAEQSVAAPVAAAIEAPGPLGPLKGTLLTPDKAKALVVLIIPGSGPTDRDGDSPLGVRAATYRLLAEGLAAQGIASVRIDKRGMFASQAAVADPDAVTITDYAADVRAWTTAGKGTHRRVRPGSRRRRRSAPGRRAARPAPVQPGQRPAARPGMAAIAALEKGQRVDTSAMHPALQPLFRASVQGFLIDEMALDPAALLASYQGPVLIMQGERDLQMGAQEARRLAAADPGARLVFIPGANHVLKSVPAGDNAANLAAYADPHLPLAPGVVDAVATFISGR